MGRLVFIALFAALTPAPVLGEGKLLDTKKARELQAACGSGAGEPQRSYLAGYVMGAADASMGKHLCPREPVGERQIIDAFCKYLNDHPKQLNRQGGLLLGLSFAEAWPCP